MADPVNSSFRWVIRERVVNRGLEGIPGCSQRHTPRGVGSASETRENRSYSDFQEALELRG